MELEKYKFLYKNKEVRKLQVTAELDFFKRFRKLSDDMYSWEGGELSSSVQSARDLCLRRGVGKKDVGEILSMAWEKAYERVKSKKKVFVIASLTHGRAAFEYVKHIIEVAEGLGCELLSRHNGADKPVETFLETVGDQLFSDGILHNLFRDTDNRWCEECGLLIAELSEPSNGVGGEWENCRNRSKAGSFLAPMLGVYMEGRKISPYITGVSEEEKSYIRFHSYRDKRQLEKIVSEFIREFS